MRNAKLHSICQQFGIVLPPSVTDFTNPEFKHNINVAMDAQPGLITTGNNGIPAYLTNIIDPEVIRILTTPNAAAEIYGEAQKGAWTDRTITFVVAESTGEVASYGDYSENGSSGVNVNFPQRQSYFYQIMSQYGDKEVEMAGLAKINYVSEIDIAAALLLNKYQNDTYFYGVAGLQNYGALNDPALPASISPITKVATGTAWDNATALEIFNDIIKLFTNLVTRVKGIQVDRSTPMTLVMSPSREAFLTKTNEYNVNVSDLLAKNFPNLKIKTAIQLTTQSGELMQMFVDKVEGKQTGFCAFPEKLRSHGFVRGSSSTRQKKSQGTWGMIWRYPGFVSSMLGI